MRRLLVALALCLSACGGAVAVSPGPVQLLTGGSEGCYAGPPTTVQGPLIFDPKNGTAIRVESREVSAPMPPVAIGTTVPVMWPTGYTGLRLASGEVEVRDVTGKLVATTGKRFDIAERPVYGFDTNGAWPACSNLTEITQ